MRKTVDFEPFYKIAAKDISYAEKLAGYAKLARERMSTTQFETFSNKHLRPLEEAAFAWFRSERCLEAIRLKVSNVFPEHEVDEFTATFHALVMKSVDDLEAASK